MAKKDTAAKAAPKQRKPRAVKAEIEPSAPDAVEPLIEVCEKETLLRIASSAESHQSRVGSAVNPTNVFALRYGNLAKAARDLVNLMEERGHTGVESE